MLKRDITATFASHFFSSILALGSSAIIARILQPEGRGLMGLVMLIPILVSTFCNLGQVTVNSTYAGLYKERRIQLFQQTLLITLFTIVVGTLILWSFFFWLPISKGEFAQLDTEMIYLACFIAPMLTLNQVILALVRGVGRITAAAKIQIAQSCTLVILLGIFLWWRKGWVKTTVVIIMAEHLFTIVMSLWILRDYVSLHPKHFSGAFFKKSLGFGVQIGLATLAGFLVYRLDQGILAYMVSKYQIGLYVVGVALAEKLKLLPMSISQAFLPRLANELEARQGQVPRVFRLTTLVSCVSMLLIGILGIPIILLLYGWNYLGSIPAFLILLPGIAALGGASILTSDLATRNKPRYSMYVGWITLVSNVAMCFLLIPIMGIAGAALASTVSYVLASVLWLIFYRKETKTPFRVMIPKTDDVKYLWQQFIILLRHILQRLRKNKPADVTETKSR